MSDKPSVLFLCTGNACRSQMAEGLARARYGDTYDVYSAGIEAHGLNPNAVAVMAEIGIDISGQQSTTLDQLAQPAYDLVVTVCGDADQRCPVFPARTRYLHHGFDDPPRLAIDPADPLNHYRRVRDEIRAFVETLPALLSVA